MKQRGRETRSHIERMERMVVNETAAELLRQMRTKLIIRKTLITRPGQKRPVIRMLVFQHSPLKNLYSRAEI